MNTSSNQYCSWFFCLRVWLNMLSNKRIKKYQSKNIKEKKSCINELPLELYIHIFSYLSIMERCRVERVCKLWKFINCEMSWRIKYLHLDYNTFKPLHKVPVKLISKIFKRCGSGLRTIDLSSPKILVHVNTILEFCPNIETLSITGKYLSRKLLLFFSNNCVKLKNISLNNCQLNDASVKYLLKKIAVKSLTIRENRKITGDCLNSIPENLTSLNLSGCTNLKTFGSEFFSRSKNVRSLSLSNCVNMRSEMIAIIFEKLGPSLITLHMDTLGNSNGHVYIDGITKCINLQELKLEYNPYMSVEIVMIISQTCLNLSVLDISGSVNNYCITDNSLKHLLNLQQLHSLIISNQIHITEIGLVELHKFAKLKKLVLEKCNVENQSCIDLVTNCHKLQHLNVRLCKDITDIVVTIASIIRNHTRIKLTMYVLGTKIKQRFDCTFLVIKS